MKKNSSLLLIYYFVARGLKIHISQMKV